MSKRGGAWIVVCCGSCKRHGLDIEFPNSLSGHPSRGLGGQAEEVERVKGSLLFFALLTYVLAVFFAVQGNVFGTLFFLFASGVNLLFWRD